MPGSLGLAALGALLGGGLIALGVAYSWAGLAGLRGRGRRPRGAAPRPGLAHVTQAQVAARLAAVPGWGLGADGRLEKIFTFRDLRQGLEFGRRLEEAARRTGRELELRAAGGKVAVSLWCPAARALSEGDFALAAEADRLAEGRPPGI